MCLFFYFVFCLVQNMHYKVVVREKTTTTIFERFFDMDYDNGIFCTVPCDRVEGAVWVVRKSDGEKITFCRGYDDVMFTVGELMKQRIAKIR
jgi:hypothetical protein